MILKRNDHIGIWQTTAVGKPFELQTFFECHLTWVSITADFTADFWDDITEAVFPFLYIKVTTKRQMKVNSLQLNESGFGFQLEQMVACWGELVVFGGCCC